MIVRMLVSIAGERMSFAPGDLVDSALIPDAEAWAMVACEDGSFRAERVSAGAEAAVVAPPERAMRPRAKGRG